MDIKFKLEYSSKGYFIFKNLLKKKDVQNCKNQLFISYEKIFKKKFNSKNIHKLLSKYEKEKQWDDMYLAFKDVSNSKAFLEVSKKLEVLTKNIFKTNTKTINSAYAIGIKDTKRTSYDWHQEKSYYSNTGVKTYHYQFCFFDKCNKKNGTMSVLEGSHSLGEILDNSYKRKFKKGVYSYVPKKIHLMKKYFKEKFINMEVGDVCIFHEDIVHKSNANTTDRIRFAGINRQKTI